MKGHPLTTWGQFGPEILPSVDSSVTSDCLCWLPSRSPRESGSNNKYGLFAVARNSGGGGQRVCHRVPVMVTSGAAVI